MGEHQHQKMAVLGNLGRRQFAGNFPPYKESTSLATVKEVNNLLKQYAQMRKMMKSFTGGGFLGKRLGKLKLPMGFGQ